MRRKSLRAAIAPATLCVGSGWPRRGAGRPRRRRRSRGASATARAVRVRNAPGAARLRPAAGRDDLARAHPPAGDRSRAPDRLAVPQPRRAGRLGGRLTSSRARPVHAGGAGAVRPRRLRPARHHPQHAAAVLRQPTGNGDRPSRRSRSRSRAEEEQVWIAADRYLDDACAQRGGAIIDHMSTANVARDMDVLRRGRRRRSSATAASRTAPTSASDVREPVPGTGSGRSSSTACSTRSPGRRGAATRRDAPVLDAAAQRRGRAGDAARSSSASATPAATRCAFSGRRGAALRGRCEGCSTRAGRDHVPGRLDGVDATTRT